MKKFIMLGLSGLIITTNLNAISYANTQDNYYPQDSRYENYYGTERGFYPRTVYSEFPSNVPTKETPKKGKYHQEYITTVFPDQDIIHNDLYANNQSSSNSSENQGIDYTEMTKDRYTDDTRSKEKLKEITSNWYKAPMNDSDIQRQIKATLKTEPSLPDSSKTILIDVTQGNVILTGTVTNPEDKTTIEGIAKGIPGVKTVKNNLDVRNK